MRAPRRLAAFVAGAVLMAGGAACTSPKRTHIVVTTNILGNVVTEIVGDQAEVRVLMRPNTNPHSFAVSAREAHTMQTADLVVYNGLGLEEGVLHHVEAASSEGVPTVEVGARIDRWTTGTATLPGSRIRTFGPIRRGSSPRCGC